MKKLLLIIVAMLFVSAASAQKGTMSAGLNFNYGFAYTGGEFSNIGIGAKFQYSFTDHLRVEPAFTYYLKKDYISVWDFMANVHYLILKPENKFNFYPAAGLGVVGVKVSIKELGEDFSASSTKFGFNIGGGAEYKLSEAFSLGAEIKYHIVSGFNHAVIQVGVKYNF